jgi:hypothetical protein
MPVSRDHVHQEVLGRWIDPGVDGKWIISTASAPLVYEMYIVIASQRKPPVMDLICLLTGRWRLVTDERKGEMDNDTENEDSE